MALHPDFYRKKRGDQDKIQKNKRHNKNRQDVRNEII